MARDAANAKWYVYRLINPLTGKVFYIGKGTGDRVDHHMREARNGKGNNEAKRQVLLEIHQAGLDVKKEIVASFSDEAAALAYESRLIKTTPGLTNIVGNSAAPRVISFCETIHSILVGNVDARELMADLMKFQCCQGEHTQLFDAFYALLSRRIPT